MLDTARRNTVFLKPGRLSEIRQIRFSIWFCGLFGRMANRSKKLAPAGRILGKFQFPPYGLPRLELYAETGIRSSPFLAP
jgi:hypothetical protein